MRHFTHECIDSILVICPYADKCEGLYQTSGKACGHDIPHARIRGECTCEVCGERLHAECIPLKGER
jgi:hypothetical protein